MISLRNLSLSYAGREGSTLCLDGVDLEVKAGRVTAVVGESGSGKSTLARCLLGLLPANARVHPGGACRVDGVEPLRLSPAELRRFRWVRASLVMQAAQGALSPLMRIRQSFALVQQAHPEVAPADLVELLGEVQLEPDRVLDAYPGQLSGGMRQRVLIALALWLRPPLLILDEPTSALDVLTQASIFGLLSGLQKRLGTTVLFITHDLSAVAQLADDVAVLYSGRVLEFGSCAEVFATPGHPYTAELLAAAPSLQPDPQVRRRCFVPPEPQAASAAGCVVAGCCPRADTVCRTERPRCPPEGGFACFHPLC